MNVPPQIIKVKRRRDEDPVQALVVNKKIRGPKDAQASGSGWLSSDSTIYRLHRTEGRGGEVQTPDEIRLGIPAVRSTVPAQPIATAAAPPPPAPTTTTATSAVASFSLSIPGVGLATPSKRKGAPESPLSMPAVVVPGIENTPPTPNATQTTIPVSTTSTLPRHGHPAGNKDSSNHLQVPQPRKYHLAHRISHKRGSTTGSPVRRGPDSPKKSAVFMEGDVRKSGGAAGAHREKKRRWEKKELRGGKGLSDVEVAQTKPTSTRKRPNVNPQERKQNEERKKKLLGQVDTGESGMDVDVPKPAQQTEPVPSARGRDAHRHPARDNIDNGDDELSKQLQAMVLEYLNVQDGITNLPETTPATRKKPLSKTQQMIGGGVGGGSWEKIDRKIAQSTSTSTRGEEDGATGTEDESEMSDTDWVYDVYVREKVEAIKKVVETTGAPVAAAATSSDATSQLSGMKPGEYGVLVISNSDDEEWFYEGGWDDDDKSEEERLSDDEDSNAEDYRTNDYPDEDDEFFAEGDDDEDDEYIIDDDEVEGYVIGRSDDEGDSESETFAKISRKRWGGAGGHGGAGRRRFPPGEEEYDLADGYDGSGYEEDEDEVGKVKRRLERGVWGIGSRGSIGDDEEDSDEEMK